jgi:hypothetical protein
MVKRQFEADKYTRIYLGIREYVTESLENDPRSEAALDRFSSWAGDS